MTGLLQNAFPMPFLFGVFISLSENAYYKLVTLRILYTIVKTVIFNVPPV